MNKTKGILVASDSHQEWPLKWCWGKYSKHNSYPVAFLDFQMSPDMPNWCKEKGILISFSYSIEVSQDEQIVTQTQNSYGKQIENTRFCWFKKPLTTTLAPFEKTI